MWQWHQSLTSDFILLWVWIWNEYIPMVLSLDMIYYCSEMSSLSLTEEGWCHPLDLDARGRDGTFHDCSGAVCDKKLKFGLPDASFTKKWRSVATLPMPGNLQRTWRFQNQIPPFWVIDLISEITVWIETLNWFRVYWSLTNRCASWRPSSLFCFSWNSPRKDEISMGSYRSLSPPLGGGVCRKPIGPWRATAIFINNE